MKQRFEKYSHDLAFRAALTLFDHKWTRLDVLSFIEEYAGISREEIIAQSLNSDVTVKLEACDAIAYLLDQIVEDLQYGIEPDMIEPVVMRPRPDGMTGKMRDIACLCLIHQLLGHVAKLGLDPLFRARILPTQHASIPGRGQTAMVKQVGRFLRRKSLKIKVAQKTDVNHAYASTQYSVAIALIEKEMPRARWLIAVLRYLGKLAPDGHLIIGGYIDAWLFNFVCSYAIRDALRQGQTRRNVFQPYFVRIVTYMDDFSLFARTETGLRKGITALDRIMRRRFGLMIRATTGVIRFDSVQRERQKKHAEKRSQRGCPNLDIGGYKVHRTYVTIRPRVVKRAIRTFSRAWLEIQETGTIRRQRAHAITSRYGAVKNTTSKYFMERYHVAEIVKMAKRITAFWGRLDSKNRKESILYALRKHAIQHAAVAGCT